MPGANNQQDPGGQTDPNKNPPITEEVDPPEGGEGGKPPAQGESFKSLEEATAFIGKLRAENAGHRTKNKELSSKVNAMEGTLGKLKSAFGGEDGEEIDPAVAIPELQRTNDALLQDKYLTDLAIENDLTGKQVKYFKFLVAEKLGELEENEELDDEAFEAILHEVRTTDARKKGKSSTGVNDGGKAAPAGADGQVTLDQFAKMNTSERSLLYTKSPAVYTQLFNEAKAKNRLRG